MEELLPSAMREFQNLFLIFGALLVGIVIIRFGIKKSVKPPRAGRYFKRNLNEE